MMDQLAVALVDTHTHTQALNKQLHPAKHQYLPSLAKPILFPSGS